MTPTHNSSYASIRFAAWHLGRRVDDRWLQGAHTQTFAKDRLGKPVRNLISQARYREVFPERSLSQSSAAADYFEFSNSNVSYYKAIGVGQGISGFRADIGAIDDPIASREDAESPTMRRKLHEWFEDDFGTRPMPGSPIFVVATRWHEDDLIGYELAKMADGSTAYPWEVINIPALAEDDDPLGREVGEGLWPEVFGTEWYTLKKLDSKARSWNSLYQGKPSDEEGGVLTRDDIKRYTALPQDVHRKDGSLFKKVVKKTTLSVDCAEKKTERSDWTAATIWIETFDKKHYLIHAVRCREEFNTMTKWIDSLAREFNVDQILVEDKGAGTQYIQVRKDNPGPAPIIPISTNNNSKMFRFDGVTPMFAGGLVFLPERGVLWIADLEDELLKFPNAKNDDYVDTVSQYLANTKKGRTVRGTARVNSGHN
jgi:predicted phage terminase large subunit-like protein